MWDYDCVWVYGELPLCGSLRTTCQVFQGNVVFALGVTVTQLYTTLVVSILPCCFNVIYIYIYIRNSVAHMLLHIVKLVIDVLVLVLS